MKTLSVIVCTHNPRENYLRRVLEGLRAQTLPFAEWELLLIDNASEKPLAGRFDLSWHLNARHVREEELGLTSARLRGISEARAEILIFVDDDTVLSADYLRQALDIGEKFPFLGAWGGNCIPEYEKPLPGWVGNQVWRLTVVEVKQDVWSNLREGFETKPVGAGMCVRKKIGLHFLEKCRAQKFKVNDRTGTILTGYGDMDLCYSALDLNLGAGRFSRLFLTHLIPASRLTLEYFVRHAEGDAMSLQIFRASHNLSIQEPKQKNLIHAIRWFAHRKIHQVSHEQYEIQKAHERGLQKGWQFVKKHLNSNSQH